MRLKDGADTVRRNARMLRLVCNVIPARTGGRKIGVERDVKAPASPTDNASRTSYG